MFAFYVKKDSQQPTITFLQNPFFHHSNIPIFPPGRRPYPPAWKLYGLEAGPEANDE
jgi:hypothetical protein